VKGFSSDTSEFYLRKCFSGMERRECSLYQGFVLMALRFGGLTIPALVLCFSLLLKENSACN
jgi:hypothetical protein